MSDKCNKYEGLFIFASKASIDEHINECPDCREEQEIMDNIASVVREAAPAYENFEPQKSNPVFLKAAAGLIVIVLVFFAINPGVLQKDISGYNLSYNPGESVISEMGLPTDDYGLLMVY